MKKRLNLVCATLLAIVVAMVSLTKASAVDNVLDYANSIGALNGAATLNRVVEATSDGGYIVGGQTAACMEYRDEDGEKLVDSEQCKEYYLDKKNAEVDAQRAWAPPSAESVCSSDFDRKDAWAMGVKFLDYVCVNYLAKFKADGTREWLTLLEDDQFLPLAVGETQNDYRMYTGAYLLYIFDKTTGELKSENYTNTIDTPMISKAKINTKGHVYYLVEKNQASYLGILTNDGRDIQSVPIWTNYSYLYAWNLLMNNDYLYASYYYYDNLTRQKTEEIVRISESLKRETIITTKENRWQDILSLDNAGNFVILECDYNDNSVEIPTESYGINCVFRSYDKNGEVLAEKKAEDMGYYYSENDVISDNFTFYDSSKGELVKLDKMLEVEYCHVIQESEVVYDITALNDGTIVAVGLGEASTSNYVVEGSGNGIQMRLGVATQEAPEEGDAADEPNEESVKNPSTVDNAQMIALGGAVVLIGAALAMRRLLGRR